MKINTITYFIKDAFKSLKRNKTISIASIITVLITFFILGIFSLIATNISNGIESVQDKVEVVVFLKDDIKEVEQKELELKLKAVDGVSEVVYSTKEEEFQKFQETSNKNDGLLKGYTLENNPFQAAFTVKLFGPKYAENVTAAVKEFECVDSIGEQQDIVDKIIGVVNGIKVVGFILFIILIGVSVFLIMNTTKLTVYSRRREVGIMKFVGATDWFIRWPFVIEGMVIGFVGAVLSTITLYFAYKSIFQWLTSSLTFVSLVNPSYVLYAVLIKFMIGGIIIGGAASAISLRKFLIV